MKKLLSVLLCVVLLCTLAFPASAFVIPQFFRDLAAAEQCLKEGDFSGFFTNAGLFVKDLFACWIEYAAHWANVLFECIRTRSIEPFLTELAQTNWSDAAVNMIGLHT